MKFSCELPIDADDGVEFNSIASITTMTRAMEDGGFAAVTVTDHPAPSSRWLAGGGHPTLDPFVALSFAAAVTTKLQLQTNILVLAYRNPFVVAKAAASLDALSDGRFIMGIGTGYSKPEYAAVGVSFDDRGPITSESIRIMRQAWAGDVVAYQGPRFTARDTVIRPLPRRPGGIPIWAGGNAKAAIRRAVEQCEGWCPFPGGGLLTRTSRTDELETPEQLREKMDFARDYAEQVGRTEPLLICMGPLDHIPIDPSDPGCAPRFVEAYARNIEIGIEWAPIILPHPNLPAFLDTVAWFSEEVIAKLPRG